MREAVIVATARTPIGKAYRGAFNNTSAALLGAHAISHAVSRAGVDFAEIDDVVMGCNMQHGTSVEYCPSQFVTCRLACYCFWAVNRSRLRFGFDGDFDCR